MKRIILLGLLLCCFSLGSCSPAEERETLLTDFSSETSKYATELELLAAKFAEDRGAFFTKYVINDVSTRFNCLQFFNHVTLQTVEALDTGGYLVNSQYIVNFTIDNGLISKIYIREEKS